MISYNPKDWILAIFRFHKADTFRALFPLLVFVGFFSWGIVYLELNVLKWTDKNQAKNITILHSLLGFAISMLLVFRTNTAYDRWWEGRKLWGSLINNSRSLAIKLNVLLPSNHLNDRQFFSQAIPLFALALKRHLLKETTRLELEEGMHQELQLHPETHHLPNQLISAMHKKMSELQKQGVIQTTEWWLVNAELQSFSDICGACERIKNTPIPYSYSTFIKKFIFIYVLTLPFGMAINLGLYAIPVTLFLLYVLASLELIAEEIEDPFGRDSNDLPMEKMAQTIRSNVKEIIIAQDSIS